jgi:chromosome segregation ATPase
MTIAHKGRWLLTAAVMVACAGALGRVSGEAQTPSRSDDLLPALLTEVKGLRAAMEQMASAGPRVQLFVSRLQLQEGRISGMVRRLDTVRDNLAGARHTVDRLKGELKMFESDRERHPGGPPQEDLAAMVAGMKKEVAAAQANVDRLVAEEAQLTQDVTAEQARWVEINQRLDELERALAKR